MMLLTLAVSHVHFHRAILSPPYPRPPARRPARPPAIWVCVQQHVRRIWLQSTPFHSPHRVRWLSVFVPKPGDEKLALNATLLSIHLPFALQRARPIAGIYRSQPHARHCSAARSFAHSFNLSRARRCVPLLLGCMALLLAVAAATARARLRSLRIVCSILCSRAVSVESRAQRAAHSQASQAGRSRAPRRRQQQQRASSSSLPRAPSVPFVVTDHGQSIMDPFHWMRGAWQGRRSRSRSRILACC